VRAMVWLGRLLWRAGVRAAGRVRRSWEEGYGHGAPVYDELGGPLEELAAEPRAEFVAKLERVRRLGRWGIR